MEDNTSKGVLSLLTLILILVPLISIVFSSIYVYNSAEFIELLAAQPLKRKSLWISIFTGLSVSLSVAFLIGCGIPILIYSPNDVGFTILLMGVLMSIIFVSIALLGSVYTKDKAKGIGIAILLWFYFSIIFDGIVLFVLFQFMDYPLEKALIGLSILNPIDLARIIILIKMDISAMMGATSAVFKSFLGSSLGMIGSISVMILWAIIPLWLSLKFFNKKNL
jgi:Cu-processing system permease protein